MQIDKIKSNIIDKTDANKIILFYLSKQMQFHFIAHDKNNVFVKFFKHG